MAYLPFNFPLDIEREIFEHAARVDRDEALRLVLVCRRVRQWVEPIVYEIVTCISPRTALQFLYALDRKPQDFFASVKSLCLSLNVRPDDSCRILEVCTYAENLACWVQSPAAAKLLAGYRPRRVSLYMSGLAADPTHPHVPDFGDPFYARVTHLEFTDDWTAWTGWTGFHRMPALTHIAFFLDLNGLDIGISSGAVLRTLREILTRCSGLQVCLLLTSFTALPMQVLRRIDPRVVMLPPPAINSHLGGYARVTEMWVEAEELVRKARASLANSNT